jgi:hypothetical protein
VPKWRSLPTHNPFPHFLPAHESDPKSLALETTLPGNERPLAARLGGSASLVRIVKDEVLDSSCLRYAKREFSRKSVASTLALPQSLGYIEMELTVCMRFLASVNVHERGLRLREELSRGRLAHSKERANAVHAPRIGPFLSLQWHRGKRRGGQFAGSSIVQALNFQPVRRGLCECPPPGRSSG